MVVSSSHTDRHHQLSLLARMSPAPDPHPPETQEASGGGGGGSGCNADRLLPRGLQRKRASDVGDVGRERKKLKEGLEEMAKLRSLVPSLRESDGRLTQVDIIEETISYIDSLHRRLADRMMSGVAGLPVLTLDHVEEAERSSQDLVNSEEQFRQRLAALSQSAGSGSSNDDNNNEGSDNTNQNSREEQRELCKPSQAASSDSEGCDDDPPQLSSDQRKAIEAVKSTFVSLIKSSTTE